MSKKVLDNLKISSDFQERFAELISESEWKKKDIPKNLGVSKEVITRALNFSIIPKPTTLIKIADRFDVSIEYLIGLTDDTSFVKSDNPKTFQERLNNLKESTKMKSCAIATELGFQRSLFREWREKDYLPSLEILFSLSRFFKVNIDYLLGRTDFKEINL